MQKTCGQVTFHRVFWEEQARGQKQKDSRGRWNPMVNKWCLHLKMMLFSACHTLRSSGCLALPSKRTLCHLAEAIRIRSYVGVVFDEMYI